MPVRTKVLRFLPLAALTALVALSIAGCSSRQAEATTAETLREASINSASAGSVRFEMSVLVSGLIGEDLAVDADGVYDLEASQMQVNLDALDQDINAVMDGQSLYLKIPMLGSNWYKADLDSEEIASNPLTAVVEDPTKILTWLQATGSDVTKIGTEEVRGEQADHYRTTLDLSKAAAMLDGEERKQAEEALKLLGHNEFPVDLWVNGDGLPVKLTYEMSFANSSEDMLRDASMKYAIEFFDWGQPVTVQVPSGDVKDLEDILGLFGG
jgi:hypothetical protein